MVYRVPFVIFTPERWELSSKRKMSVGQTGDAEHVIGEETPNCDNKGEWTCYSIVTTTK